MNLTLLIVCILVLLLLLGVFLFIHFYNQFQLAIIRISEAENNIDIYLQKKLEFLTRLVPLIKENLKEGSQEFEKILLLKSKKINSFELNKELEKSMHTFLELMDLNASLGKVENILSLQVELEENEDDLEASKKYYNDHVTSYNKLVRSFPSNLVGLIFKYRRKEFYSDEKEEMFQILKDE